MHLQQNRASGGETAHIGDQATIHHDHLSRCLNQPRWTMVPRRRPPQHPSQHEEGQQAESNAISGTTSTQKSLSRCLEGSPFSSGKPRASRSANQPSATLRARLRMRPMVAALGHEITPRASRRLKV